ncbi:hypothetical protein TKK_0005785 [Trichogramma kaykai]
MLKIGFLILLGTTLTLATPTWIPGWVTPSPLEYALENVKNAGERLANGELLDVLEKVKDMSFEDIISYMKEQKPLYQPTIEKYMESYESIIPHFKEILRSDKELMWTFEQEYKRSTGSTFYIDYAIKNYGLIKNLKPTLLETQQDAVKVYMYSMLNLVADYFVAAKDSMQRMISEKLNEDLYKH